MKQLKHYLLIATLALFASEISLTEMTLASSKTVFSPFQSLPVNQTITSQNLPLNKTDSASLLEEFSFLIENFKLDHQSEINNLNIKVRYHYVPNISNTEYPDFRLIAKDIEMFLTNYPNDKDYWEILNKKITLMVLEKYPSIIKVTCEMQVSPSSLVPYSRSSTATRYRPSAKINGKKSIRIK
jgi:hypothetical protein